MKRTFQSEDFFEKYRIKHITFLLYNPKAQELVKQTNTNLEDRLRSYTKNSTDWNIRLEA